MLNGTYRPDFAEVESDATQIVLDPRNAVSYPEKRPFFLDGLEQFNTPNNLIYTRRSRRRSRRRSSPARWAMVARVSGRTDEEDSSADRQRAIPCSTSSACNAIIGSESIIGATLTDKEQGGAFNRLASVDARFTFDKIYSLQLQAAASSTRDSAGTGSGDGSALVRPLHARRSDIWIRLPRSAESTRSSSPGLASSRGTASRFASLDHRVTFYAPPGGLVETFGGDFRSPTPGSTAR